MPNPIKYTTSSGSLALKKGNFLFGTGDVGKGPSDTTGYYQGVDVPKPGYVVYQYREGAPGSLTYASFTGDTEFINFTNGLASQTFTSTTQCLVYYRGQSDKVCFNRDYESIVTDGLVLNLDAGFDGSYPESGVTFTDLSLSGKNGTLINSPGYYANGGGGIVFDGVDDSITISSITTTDTFTYSCWLFPITSGVEYQTLLVQDPNRGIFYIGTSKKISYYWAGGTYGGDHFTTQTLTENAWNNVVVMNSGGTLSYYINGVLDSSTYIGAPSFNAQFIGNDSINEIFKGRMSNIQLYNRVLTSSEVLQNYNAMKDRFAFIFTVDTTKTGVSTSTQFKLPLVSSGSINFVVEWGDGTTNTITTFNQAETTHTYSSGGVYEIKIRGVLKGWQFNNDGDRLKMGIIKNWGCLDISVSNAFRGCANLTCTATDAPTISSTSLAFCFADCTNFNGPIGNWDVSNVTTLSLMFSYATKFNQNIGSWNVSKVTSMYEMFRVASSFNNGGSPSINNWNTSSLTDLIRTFEAANSFNQPIGNWNMSGVTTFLEAFVGNQAFNQDIGSWNTSNVTNMARMFDTARAFNNGGSPSINNWNTSKVSGSGSDFQSGMSWMFKDASNFNQPLSGWNVSNVVNMGSMFNGATKFNQNIGSWNVSGVTNMSSMFQSSSFNNGDSSSIGNWNTSNVTNMSSMFNSNSSFNQNINGWNTSKVTNMAFIFRFATKFNQPIGSWVMSGVTTMWGMFESATAFNQNIGSWDTSNATIMIELFSGANNFNNGGSPSIANWNVSKVTNMQTMFGGANSFNHPIGNWDVSNVTNMSYMFGNASAFNQDIGNWNISGVTTFVNFMSGKSPSNFSSSNLDSIYNKWSLLSVKPNINITFGTAKYSSSGSAGRAVLAGSPNNWTITDGGQV